MNLQMTTPTEVAMQSKNNELANVASLLENLQQLSMNKSSSIAAAPYPRHSPLPRNRRVTTILELIIVCYLKKVYSCIIQHLIQGRLLPSEWYTDIFASESLTSLTVSLGVWRCWTVSLSFSLYQMMKPRNNLRTPSNIVLVALWVRRQLFSDDNASALNFAFYFCFWISFGL